MTYTLSDINTLIDSIMNLRIQIGEHTQHLDNLKLEKDALQEQLIQAMKTNSLKSWKTNTGSFALVSKYDIRIEDENRVIKELTARNISGLVVPKVDTTRFKQIANIMLQETGEVFPGAECIKTEYISIRTA